MMFLLMIGGVTSAWGKVIYPNKMHNFRTNNATPTAWNGGDWANPITNKDGSNLETVEVNTQNARIWAIEQFVIPNIDHVTSITITQKKKSGSNAAIWYFPYDYPTGNAYNSTYVDNVKSVLGVYPGAEYTNSPTIDDVSGATVSLGEIETIKTTFASCITDNTLTLNLLLTTKTGVTSQGQFYTQKEDNGNNRPYITVTYYVAEVGSTRYTTLESAVTAAEEGSTIKILEDCKLTSRVVFDKNLTIEPNRADITVTIDGSVTGDYYALGLATAGKTVTIGSSTYAMTIDGNKNTYGDRKLLEVGNGQVNLLNLTIKDAYTSTSQGVVCAKGSGKVQLTDIAFNGCQSTNDTTPCIVFNGGNDQIILSGNNTFTDCTADLSGTYTNCNIYLERRVKIDAGISNTTPIRLYAKESNIALGNPVATQSLPADEARFFILNKDYACYSKSNGSSRADLTICEGKTLDVTAAEAATLVLPFAATIPEGVTCYTLTHTDGASSVVATEVTGGTLAAETPVLVNATMGSYKFRNSSKATTATSIPGSPSVSGALTGVYSDLTFTTENISSTYANTYILNKIDDSVGFYKAASGKKVGANRAYLTATNVPAGARLGIVFDDDETTGIENLTPTLSKGNGAYYNLSGRRVAQPTRGLYIVNGKKVVIK